MICYSAGWQRVSKYSKIKMYIIKAISCIDNSKLEVAAKSEDKALDLYNAARDKEAKQLRQAQGGQFCPSLD